MRQTIHVLAPSGGSRRTPTPPFAARISDAIRKMLAKLNASLSRPALNRRVLHRLSVLSERELRDIGLTRADVVQASMPENGDATHFLIARRDERLSARVYPNWSATPPVVPRPR